MQGEKNILRIFNDWRDIKNICRNTANKKHTEKNATPKFKEAILISEHSPIREWRVRWYWETIKSWVATHYSRHKWECYIGTRRTDRTGVDRGTLSQEELVPFDGSANAQNLIDTARKRLCFQSSKETRNLFYWLKYFIGKKGETEVANVLVPNCVYRCGCPEFENCKLYEKVFKELSREDLMDIRKRYKAYNNYFEHSFKSED